MQIIEGYAACRAALEVANAARSFSAQPEIEATVREICEAVRVEGDAAVMRYERQFDCPALELSQLRVSAGEIEAAWREVGDDAKRALERAAQNIEAFHRRQPHGDWHTFSPDGVFLGQRYTPIERAGLYAPNARAALPSSVLMIAMPARVAGVREMALVSPPSRDGSLHPVLLAAARVAGITEIYKIGGAVAMAALAYGTQTVRAVDKIVGPANIYGTLAKKHLFGVVGVDGLYGPSDVVILADESASQDQRAAQIAADLIAQAEHGADSWVCLVSPSRDLCDEVLVQIETQAQAAPRRDIIAEALKNALVLCVESDAQMSELGNLAAPEHLEIWSRDALTLSGKIHHAGAIFLNTPVPLGDYIAGPSHTLPTGMTARFSGGVDVGTFLKRTSLISASREVTAQLCDDLEIIAALEGLPAHAESVRRAASRAASTCNADSEAR